MKTGELWRAVRNPYPLKGHFNTGVPWDIGTVYQVIGVIPMHGRCPDIIGFKVPGDPNPMGGWEIGVDTFKLGFEKERA